MEIESSKEEITMTPSLPLVVFTLDEQRYALHLSAVRRVIRRVAITPLPKAPEIVLGVINAQGYIIPVVDLRKRFRVPERAPALSDQMIIAQTSKRSVALIVDAVADVLERPSDLVITGERILPGLAYVAGVITLDDGIVLIHDLDTFLSLEEEATLDQAMGDI